MKKADKPQKVDYDLRKIEVAWIGPEKVPERYVAENPQRERSGTAYGKIFEVKWFPDKPAILGKDGSVKFDPSKTGVSKIFIDGELFYSVGAPYAIAFLEQFPQAATFEIVEVA